MFWCSDVIINSRIVISCDTQCKVCFEAKESYWRLNLQAMTLVRRVLIDFVMSFKAANSIFWVGQAASSLVLWSCKAWFSFPSRYITFACLIWCFGRKLFCTKVNDPNLFVKTKLFCGFLLQLKLPTANCLRSAFQWPTWLYDQEETKGKLKKRICFDCTLLV